MPLRARWLRVLLAELERLYNHLHYLGHLANTTTLKVGDAQGKLLEERAKQINARLTGSRFLRSLLARAGCAAICTRAAGSAKSSNPCERKSPLYVERLEASESHLDRLITTGVLQRRSHSIRAPPGRSSAPPVSIAICGATIPMPPMPNCRTVTIPSPRKAMLMRASACGSRRSTPVSP